MRRTNFGAKTALQTVSQVALAVRLVAGHDKLTAQMAKIYNAPVQ
jgi:hypothetical protein